MRRWLQTRGWVVAALIVIVALANGSKASPGVDKVPQVGAQPAKVGKPGTIAIGSKNFTENRLLGEIMAQLIEARTNLTVERKLNLGGTTVVFSALRDGQVDLYPEYTGTGWAIHLKIQQHVSDPLRAYLRVAAEFRTRFNITWLWPFGFSNSFALAMGEARAKELGIRSISDLKAHESDLKAGVSHEFLNRDDGYPGLAKAYGLELGEVRGMEHGLAYAAILSGQIDVVDTWTTDGKLLRYKIRILDDDKGFFPPYDCAPIVRTQTLLEHPELSEVLNRLAFKIDDDKMRKLNYRVEEEGGSFEQVASDFLRSEGLLSGKGKHAAEVEPDQGFFGMMWERRGETMRLVVEHLWLTAVAVFLAVIVALPLGILLTRKARLAPWVFGIAGVIQTIPSLALLAFMIPFPGLGLGARSAIAALFLYALLPIIRNTYTGIKGVDPDLLEAARAMGLRDGQILRLVELPLATRTIMAGIRTATVISIGVATLGAFIGAGGLGDPIVTGLQLNDSNLILSGAVPAAVLALIVDFGLGLAEHLLAPKGMG